MKDFHLTKKDKIELTNHIKEYSKRIEMSDIDEIDSKLTKKLKKLKNLKNSPAYIAKMISQIEDLSSLLNSPSISNTKLDQVIASLHYFIWAEDKIPDYLPKVGYVDDAYVISIVHKEVQKYLPGETK